MILILPIVIMLTFGAVGMLVMQCVGAPTEVQSAMIVISVSVFVSFCACLIPIIKKSIKRDKPYYLIVILCFIVVCLVLYALRSQMYDFLLSILSPIGPGSLPEDMVN